MELEYNCKVCKYSTKNKYTHIKHGNSKEHLYREELNKYCMLCNKTFKTKQIYWQHRKKFHSNTDINKKELSNKTIISDVNISDNTLNNINNNIIDMNNKINNKIDEVKEEIHNSKKEVVTVVNKAITKASSLIKYLMQNHRSVPPLKKIKKEECISILRLDYDCPEKEGDYLLQKMLIRDYSNNIFVQNIAKSILKIINHEQQDKQPIYNTDSSRYNYVVKTTTDLWNEDKSGIKFTDYIIRPLLRYIRELNEDYIDNVLEKVNMRKNTFYENEMHINAKEAAYNLDIAVTNDYLIKPLLKELSPYLRFLQLELEELEKIEELNNIHNELEEYINSDKTEEEIKPKKKNKSKINKI
jgi:hypothetical protein